MIGGRIQSLRSGGYWVAYDLGSFCLGFRGFEGFCIEGVVFRPILILAIGI